MSTFELTDAASWGGRPVARRIANAHARARVVVAGTIRTTETVTCGSSPAYRCALSDGTGELDVLFVGRTAVPGLAVGTRCSVEGTARLDGARLVVWNPLYRLEAGDEAPIPARAGSPPENGAPGERSPSAQSNEVEPAALEVGTNVTDVTGITDVTDAVETTGRFRIYLGAAAGVGKTIAMLDEGRRRRARGTDVVIGFVESHGRSVTEDRTSHLEVVPRRVISHRGTQFEEMDLDAVLLRHPDLVLIDELAHTNVPGTGRHEKRWDDVLELLDAGIDVISNVNVQHLESIADAVERITGAPVRERVPDWVVRRADQIELVDSSPWQLRRRMLHGNIYPQEQVPDALAHFFRADNLTALRELALRFLADATEEELLKDLERQHPEVLWETTERIMVGVTDAPGTDAVIRRAARMAARMKAELHAVHVTDARTGRRSRDDHLADLRRVASEVGANWHEPGAEDTAEALIQFAQRHQITQIVLGASQRSRWQEIKGGGSIVTRVTRLATSTQVDIHIIGRHERPAP